MEQRAPAGQECRLSAMDVPSVELSPTGIEEGLDVLRVSSRKESTALALAGQWLEQQTALGRGRLIEDIDWELNGPIAPEYTLILTVSASTHTR